MADDRATVLGAVRRALAREAGSDERRRRGVADQRMQQRAVGPQPRLAEDLIGAFTERLAAAAATWTRATTPTEAVHAVGEYARQAGHDTMIAADHPDLRRLPWPADLQPHFGAPADGGACGLTLAELGVAETGSLVLCAASDTPTLYNFLPDILICVLSTDAIVAHLEDAWRWLRSHRSPLPRAVNLVTGPSRTADVEQRLQLGAHGPRQLHAVLVDDGLRSPT
ncbi:MAG: LUD domain-containing protein [Gammaproteobacteria bacterium]